MDALGPLGSGFESLDLLSFEEEPKFEPQVMEKASKMKQKYDLIHEHFQVPTTETIIQDYRCSMLYEGDFSGKIYITQNYVLFLSADQHKQETIPFYKVIAIGKIRTTLVVPAIFIETESSKIIFTGFIHREEAYNLLEHLWQYQPNYVQLNENDILRSVKSDFPDHGEGKHNERLEPVEQLGGRWGAMIEEKPTEKDYVKVESAKSTLELAHEIQELNAIALERLQAQAEVIDRTETSLNKTKNKLDEGGRILDGVESVAGQMKNLATPNLYKYRETGAHQAIDRTVVVDVENNIDVPVLIKESNDFLAPGFVRFSEKNFSILDHLLKPLKKQKWGYAQVSKVIIRARHQHLDIRFHNSTDRFRCCTAFIQGLTNELFLRTTSKILLIHEPRTRKFQYGSLAIRERTLRGTRKAEAEEIHGVFEIPKARYSELFSGAPEAVVEKVAERDADLDKIAEALKVIQAGSSAINNETARQVDQLKDMNKTATNALKTGHNDTFRTKRLG